MGRWIDSGKSLDDGFSLIGNRVPTLEFDSGISDLLGEGNGVFGTKRGVAGEENVGDDGCAERDELVFCLCVENQYLSTGFPWPVFLTTWGAT